VSDCGLAIYIILRQKKNYGNSSISPWKKKNLKTKSSKRNQNPSRYYNFITNLKFQPKQKLISSFKNPHTKIVSGLAGRLVMNSFLPVGPC
jgi:hypothetical protein